ncbi:hypothetical protein FACS1894113_4100 [Alphaproteobacteria bacterium]|nr:hypothetical protein FACS1894113_4100 [Alphaproteobacteria bacterium]
MFKLRDEFYEKEFIIDLKLCRILMEDKEFSWLLLIPRRANIIQIDQLSDDDCLQLMKEIKLASNVMNKLFSPDRLNVAAIGNKTPQLHVHVIARKTNDSLWPETVWGKPMSALTSSEKIARAQLIRSEFEKINI